MMKRLVIALATILVLAAAPAYARAGHRGGAGMHGGRAHVSHGGGYHGRHVGAGGYRGGYRGGYAGGYRGGYGYRRGYGAAGAAVGLGVGAAAAGAAVTAPFAGQTCPAGYYLASDYQCYPRY